MEYLMRIQIYINLNLLDLMQMVHNDKDRTIPNLHILNNNILMSMLMLLNKISLFDVKIQ